MTVHSSSKAPSRKLSGLWALKKRAPNLIEVYHELARFRRGFRRCMDGSRTRSTGVQGAAWSRRSSPRRRITSGSSKAGHGKADAGCVMPKRSRSTQFSDERAARRSVDARSHPSAGLAASGSGYADGRGHGVLRDAVVHVDTYQDSKAVGKWRGRRRPFQLREKPFVGRCFRGGLRPLAMLSVEK
jgi:hypothetical protein